MTFVDRAGEDGEAGIGQQGVHLDRVLQPNEVVVTDDVENRRPDPAYLVVAPAGEAVDERLEALELREETVGVGRHRRVRRLHGLEVVGRRRSTASGPGREGEPSATDFLVLDLPPVVDRFATDFGSQPEAVSGFPRVRVLIASGTGVPAFAVYGLLADAGDTS